MRTRFLPAAALLALGLSACVDVDKETAASPREYWKPPARALPAQPLAVSAAMPGLGGAHIGTGPLDLPTLVDIALSNNPSTRQAWYAAKAAAAQLGQTNSVYYPQITVGANVSRDKVRSVLYNGAIIGSGTYYSTTYGPSAELNYTLWNFGQNYAQSEAARQALYAANYQYNQEIQNVILATELAYFNFNAALGFVDASKATLEDAQTSYSAAQKRLETGLGDKQSALQALAQVKNAEFQLESASAQVEASRAQLARALGIHVSAGLDIVPNQSFGEMPLLDEEVSALMAAAMRQRPLLMAAYANAQVARFNVEAAKASRWPVISAVASALYGYSYGGATNGNPYNDYSVGLTLSWNIFTGFNTTYSIINAQQQHRAAQEALRASELQIVSDVWNYYYAFRSATRQVESTTAEVTAQQEAYDAINLGYQNGLNSYVDLLTALDNLATARRQRVQADANLGIAISNLAHATGNLPLEQYSRPK